MENSLRTRARQKHENKTKAQAQETQETQETQAKEKKKETKSKKTRTISIFGEFHITRTTDEHFDRTAWS